MTIDELLPASLRAAFPALGATERDPHPTVRAKFFYPDFDWTWYAVEFDGADTFFGFVDGFELEWGYFSLRELRETRGKLGCAIERDLHFTPRPAEELFDEISRNRRRHGR